MSLQFYVPKTSYFNHRDRLPLGSIAREVNQIFNDLLYSDEQQDTPLRTPQLKVKYDEKNVTVVAEVPGVDKKDISLAFKDGVLAIETKVEEDKKENNSELTYAYKGAVSIETEVNDSKLEAALKNGILTITLPKKEEEKAKEIAIQVQ